MRPYPPVGSRWVVADPTHHLQGQKVWTVLHPNPKHPMRVRLQGDGSKSYLRVRLYGTLLCTVRTFYLKYKPAPEPVSPEEALREQLERPSSFYQFLTRRPR